MFALSKDHTRLNNRIQCFMTTTMVILWKIITNGNLCSRASFLAWRGALHNPLLPLTPNHGGHSKRSRHLTTTTHGEWICKSARTMMLVLLMSPPRCTKEWALHQVDQHLVMPHRVDLEPAQVRKVDLDQAEVLTPKVGLDQIHLHQVQMEDSCLTAQLWLDSHKALHLCVTVWTMTQLYRIAWMTPIAHEDSWCSPTDETWLTPSQTCFLNFTCHPDYNDHDDCLDHDTESLIDMEDNIRQILKYSL